MIDSVQVLKIKKIPSVVGEGTGEVQDIVQSAPVDTFFFDLNITRVSSSAVTSLNFFFLNLQENDLFFGC